MLEIKRAQSTNSQWFQFALEQSHTEALMILFWPGVNEFFASLHLAILALQQHQQQLQQQSPPQQIETELWVALASTTNTKSVLELNIHHVLDIRFVSGANIQLFSDQL